MAVAGGLFVYGSLRPGESAHHLVAPGLVAAEAAVVEGRLVDLGAFPGYRPGNGWVLGYLLRLRRPEAILPILDRYEGYFGPDAAANRYRREVRRVVTAAGFVWAEIYVLVSAFGARPVIGGDWRLHRLGRVAVAWPAAGDGPWPTARRLLGEGLYHVAEIPLAELPVGGGEVVALVEGGGSSPRLRTAVLLQAPLRAGRRGDAAPRR